jgi:hypothetical protein
MPRDRRESDRQYREANLEKLRAKDCAYYAANADRIKERVSEWIKHRAKSPSGK